MSFDVGRFAAEMNGMDGFQLASKFRVRAHSPTGDSRFFEFTCHAIDIPGMTISTVPVRVLGYGVPVDAPLVPAYGETNLQCYIDNNGQLLEFFTQWQQAVVNFNYAPGQASAVTSNGAYPFQVSYAEDYVGLVEIDTFDQSGFKNRTVTLHDAWPRSVGQMQHSWGAKDTLSVLPVQLSYRSWTSDDMSPSGSTLDDENTEE